MPLVHAVISKQLKICLKCLVMLPPPALLYLITSFIIVKLENLSVSLNYGNNFQF